MKDVIADVASGKITPTPKPVAYDENIEAAIARVLPGVQELVGDRLSPRWVAMRLIEDDTETLEKISHYLGTSVTTDAVPTSVAK